MIGVRSGALLSKLIADSQKRSELLDRLVAVDPYANNVDPAICFGDAEVDAARAAGCLIEHRVEPDGWIPVSIAEEDGDSGSPVYSRKTGKVVGMNVFGPPSTFTPFLARRFPKKALTHTPSLERLIRVAGGLDIELMIDIRPRAVAPSRRSRPRPSCPARWCVSGALSLTGVVLSASGSVPKGKLQRVRFRSAGLAARTSKSSPTAPRGRPTAPTLHSSP
jgi:hypothetical protein